VTLAAGTRLGPYEIRASIGAGGMGEVYKARDTRLDRTVAIKILPETLAADPQFRERFDREARTISKLDHPHICTLYDVGEQDGSSFLVMQYLEGETLEARLKKGALPLAQALQVAAQIADALATAHKAGIVHRDLKPGNIMLTKSGARLLDFGLAKTGASVLSGTNLSILPTTPPITQPGSILGTFQYMAPEQLEGQEADARTDIFAFGAVVYEMVTGKKAFEGKSQAGLISVIMSGEPKPLLTQDPMVPPALDHVVKGCLAKDPDRRWQVAQDLLLQLRWIAEEGAQPGIRLPPTGQWRQREKITQILVAITSLLVVGVAALLFVSLRRPRTASEIRFLITAPNLADNSNNALAVSPDGRSIAFVAATPAKTFGLFVRQMGSTAPQLLAGTEGAANPFWSPDSRFIAFSANETLRKIDVSGGPPQTLCEWSGRNRAHSGHRDHAVRDGDHRILTS
jgi:serine/threonine protein kinase